MPTGTVNGNEMILCKNAGSHVQQRRDGKCASRSRAPPRRAARQGPRRLFGARNEPIDVTSATLEIDDNAKAAVFKGDVRASRPGRR